MKGSDPIMHHQLYQFAEAARKSMACERIIIISTFWDEDAKKNVTALTLADEKDNQSDADQMADIVDTLLQGAATVMSDSGFELYTKNTRSNGELEKFRVDKPHSLTISVHE